MEPSSSKKTIEPASNDRPESTSPSILSSSSLLMCALGARVALSQKRLDESQPLEICFGQLVDDRVCDKAVFLRELFVGSRLAKIVHADKDPAVA